MWHIRKASAPFSLYLFSIIVITELFIDVNDMLIATLTIVAPLKWAYLRLERNHSARDVQRGCISQRERTQRHLKDTWR